jgi:hypothetical protein
MSTKYPSPLLGYNNNVRHKGKVFHIQTEDSGVKYGHIITHLFMDGGRILKSVKTSYAEYVGNVRVGEIVREMMKQQHKAMFIALRDGKFDPTIEASGEAAQTTQAVATDSQPRNVGLTPAAAAVSPTTLRASTEAAAAGAASKRAAHRAPAPARATDPYAPAAAVAAGDEPDGPPTEATRQLPPELTLDIEALERAAAAASTASPTIRAASDLPPPPASLFREKSSGKYKVAAPVSAAPLPPIPRVDPPEPGAKPAPGTDVVGGTGRAADPGSERRYAPTRPAAIFGQVRPQQGKSMFGEDLIGDKSLDEVILSYLAEDLDEEKKK